LALRTSKAAPAVAKGPGEKSGFSASLIEWQARYGRSGLPWQDTRDPYRVWLSEIMLQQTQVGTVIPYYERFLQRFPTVQSLAAADLDAVLALWGGLGYYSRARNLHAAARTVMERHGGAFPATREELEDLPGIGRSTAAAISAFAFGAREAILDGNVKRVLARHFAIPGFTGDKRVENGMWELAESLLPAQGIEIYTQAVMDLGATVCVRSRPACLACPVAGTCLARARGQTADFPGARPRKAVPLRHTAMLLLMQSGQILLEKRPATGVWGGLWCLPEMPQDADAVSYCADRFGVHVASARDLAMITHTFTHFTLNIRPVVCHVRELMPRAAEPARRWVAPGDTSDYGVPAPVKKLLAVACDFEPER
jgi:A/G-specific adenine glycosylase